MKIRFALAIAFSLLVSVSFAQEPVKDSGGQLRPDAAPMTVTAEGKLTVAPKLAADEQATFDFAKVQQVTAEAAVMKTAEYRAFVKAQQELQKAQANAQEKQKAMLAVLQSTPEYKAMMVLRQNLEQRIKGRGEKNIIDWNTGELKKPAPPQNARR